MNWINVATLVVTVVFIGIPTAAGFYPELLSELYNYLPLEELFPWIERIGIFLAGTIVARYYNYIIVSNNNRKSDTPNKIRGCIEKHGVIWRCESSFINNDIKNIYVHPDPRCPKCNTEMKTTQSARGARSGIESERKCPNSVCQHIVEYNSTEGVEAVFKKHIENIVKSDQGSEKNITNLIKSIDGEPTPERIWKKYVSISTHPNLSDSCLS